MESEGLSLVVDPLADPAPVFAPFGDRAREAILPNVVPAAGEGRAVAGLVTHLHRDHADAGALAQALAGGAAVYEPAPPGGSSTENLALAQAEAELKLAGLERQALAAWEQRTIGPFTITALPAVDGLGDPQLSWLVEAGGRRVLHLGDTVFHGYWWRMAQRHGPFDVVFVPINGAVVRFGHLRPASPIGAALDPEQAALAGELLGARTVVPMHYDGFSFDPWYRPVPRAEPRFLEAARGRPYEARVLGLGESMEIA
jgi:L-ascorbate metabolism protein UlaG (beta-lactamase superfamily)